ncbi:TerB family tellurite resistance protein [Bowmanella denitrificans]|uniref:tellurite resistance TerB family protein n=1 Tax=Bowmanella denitrificans TaxID=366582 RepID=UPI001FEBFB7D|nr:TerB family tellurite resistance protein [Bowmanella denitrificans]
MISKVKQWLKARLDPVSQEQTSKVDLATAVLCMEVIRADNQLDDTELDLLCQLLQKEFDLPLSQAKLLLTESRAKAEQAADLVSFTRLLNEQCSAEQKCRMLENLWRLALVDGRLDVHEEHIIRRIADLLYIPHSQFIQTKLKAQS